MGIKGVFLRVQSHTDQLCPQLFAIYIEGLYGETVSNLDMLMYQANWESEL